MPTATTITSIPSINCGMPKVSRSWPVDASMPTRPMNNPIPSDARPRIREDPNTIVTAPKATTISAK